MREIEMMLVRDVIWTRCISVLDVAQNGSRGQLLEGSFDAAIIKIFIWVKGDAIFSKSRGVSPLDRPTLGIFR